MPMQDQALAPTSPFTPNLASSKTLLKHTMSGSTVILYIGSTVILYIGSTVILYIGSTVIV